MYRQSYLSMTSRAVHMHTCNYLLYTPGKLTWNLTKLIMSKSNLLFQGPIFRFHIMFLGGFPIDTLKKKNTKIFSWKVILEYHAIENICRSPMILGVNTFTGSSYLPVKSIQSSRAWKYQSWLYFAAHRQDYRVTQPFSIWRDVFPL